MHTIYYAEEQKVTNIWIWLLLATVAVVFIYGFTDQLILQHSIGPNPAPDWAMAIIGMVPLCMLFITYKVKLYFKIDEDGINYRFQPFHFNEKQIKWDDIETIYVRKYKPILEYGGWGFRTYSFKRNIAFNISGNDGLQIEMKDGKKILLGTQNPEELEKIVSQITHIKKQIYY